MKWFGTVLAVGLMIAPCMVRADQLETFGWEDGTSTILGMYPALGVTATNVAAPDPVHAGNRSLKLLRNSTTTAEAFVAWITGLTDGDLVTVSFWRYDTTPDVGPSCRLWASYTYGGGINRYAGGAEGDLNYGPGTGWDQTSYTWTFNSDGGTRDGLRIEARIYSAAGAIVWVDDLSVQAPDTAVIYLPNETLPPVPPLAHGRFTTMMTNGATTSIALCSEAGTYPVSYASITEITSNGTLWDGGTQITSTPWPLTSGDRKTVGYDSDAGYSGLDTFRFTVTDNQATPLISDESTHEVGVQAGGVVISEVMHSPSSYQSDYEFVEIFNYSGSAVYLTTLDTTPGPYNMPTEDNLANALIPNGGMKLIAIDNTVDYSESAWVFGCEWGLKESTATWYSLQESDIIRVPVANWEFLSAYPSLTSCVLTEGSRLLVFGKVGGIGNPVVLLDGLNLARPDGGTSCSGSSYAIDPTFMFDPLLTADNNDDPNLNPWYCHSAFNTDGGRMTGVTGDQASPGYVPTRFLAPDYDDPCLGACCDPAGCTANVQESTCQDACGIWRGKDSPCGYDQNFVNCLEVGGPGVGASNYCHLVFDLDADWDVDLKDFALFQQGDICRGCGTIEDEGYIDYPNEREACVTAKVVHMYDMINSGTSMDFYIQDETGTRAMSVYGPNACILALEATPGFAAGAVCQFRGVHKEYYNLQELDCNAGAIQVCDCVAGSVPTPLDLTVQDLASPFLPGEDDPRRAYIGTLVRITNARVMGGGTFTCPVYNYTIQDFDNSSYTMILVTSATGLPICNTTKPADTVRVSIVGILGTYNNAFQIMPRKGYLASGTYPTYDITQYTP
ncbi:MAG: hypothetical protein V2A79_12730 [Planctomycetota bacterium]